MQFNSFANQKRFFNIRTVTTQKEVNKNHITRKGKMEFALFFILFCAGIVFIANRIPGFERFRLTPKIIAYSLMGIIALSVLLTFFVFL